MVNVPPIPPLLCSTPPPIDFGEEDEDLDVMPPTLDGMDDEEFGDFLTVDDDDNGKNDEPLPSPRPSSVTDLPPMSIYDGIIPPDEDLTNQQTPLSTDNNVSKETPNNKTITNIAEAFNYNIKNINEEVNNTAKDNNKDTSQEIASSAKTNDKLQTEMENSCKNQRDCEIESINFDNKDPGETKNVLKNPKDLRIETSNLENNCNSDKTNLSSMQNMVSIEDIEDDLSDDEVYSPKTQKNFTHIDSIKDYFIIQEIKTETLVANGTKTKEVTKEMDTKSVDSLDNNESVSLEDNNEFNSFSSNSFPQQTFDLPPPLDNQPNSIDDEDDFGDFADFQDFGSAIIPAVVPANVDNSVPVNDIKQLDYKDLEQTPLNEFNNHNSQIDSIGDNYMKDFNGFPQIVEFNKSLDDGEFDEFTSHRDNFEIPNDEFQQFNQKSSDGDAIDNYKITESSEIDITNKINVSVSQENLNDSINDVPVINKELTKLGNGFGELSDDTLNVKSSFRDVNEPSEVKEGSTNLENSFEDLTEPHVIAEKPQSNLDDGFGDFNEAVNIDEFPKLKDNILDKFIQSSEKQHDFITNNGDGKEITSNFENSPEDDDEFNDFASFEQHQEIPEVEQTFTNDANDFEDDDNFGEFNTAEPVTPTASTIAPLKTSQNVSTTATPMLMPKNLNERISKILQLMFNPTISNTAEHATKLKAQKIYDIPFTSIDAAKALEYQWLNSDTRHSFIRSLGIDSRNILFGENWNPSLPRFAANLSFNPLKPMKPISSSSNMADSCSVLEPVYVNSTDAKKPLSVDSLKSIKKENIDIYWKSSIKTEQTKEAFKDNIITAEDPSSTNTTTPLRFVSNEPPPTEIPSLTIFENPLDIEDKLSKTPPISEMESVTTFSSPLPTTALDMEISSTPIINNLNDFDLKEVEENLKSTLNLNEVVATSTFTGSFKETHIYTPSKTNEFETKQTAPTSSPSKCTPIDFDYEKAAMGVVIDETVVKKEYRDVEYNPPFSMESLNNKSITNKSEMFEANIFVANSSSNNINGNDVKMSVDTPVEEQESNDDFTEFQSVSSEITPAPLPLPSVNNTKPKQYFNKATEVSAKPAAAVSHGGMILSPAILIPQAIFMENNKPKIEWGDSTANINADEMARIEELFPEPKSVKSSNTSNSSQKSTPTHQVASTPSISATVHNKEFGGCGGGSNNDDDDWSDFVSVPITNNASTNRSGTNNNILTKSPAGSPFKQRSPVVPHRMPMTHANNSNNDDEWSDFVSSAPQPTAQPPSYRVPQFNSGAWQNANFYNNPLSMYHKGPINFSSTAAAKPSPKHLYNNNNNNYNNAHQQQQYHQTTNNVPPGVGHHHHQPTPQQIHIMQNFSTAPVPTPERLTSAATNTTKNNQFQVGSAKVAPSIALIPDLGFVAPAIPTHTSFINSLPKPSINTKK